MQISKWVALGVAAFCLMAVGGVVNMPHLYFMAAMLISLPMVSYLFGLFSLSSLKVTREIPIVVWEGETVEVTYIVTNRSRITRFFVSIRERAGPFRECRGSEPAVFNVRGHESVRVVSRLRFLRRGVFGAASYELASVDPLGVFSFTRSVPSEDEIVVYPVPAQVEPIDVVGAERHGWNEAVANALQGAGVDPAGVRSYLPGDPLRHIHWRQTARTGNLTVIEYEETQSVNLRIVLDTHQRGVVGADPRTSLEAAIKLAATAARDAARTGAKVELITVNKDTGNIQAPALARRENDLFVVLDSLARIESQDKMSIAELLKLAAGALPRGTSIVLVCLHPDAELLQQVQHCIACGVLLSAVLVDTESYSSTQAAIPFWQVSAHEMTGRELASTGIPVYSLAAGSAATLSLARLS